jgi:hypothetical protein
VGAKLWALRTRHPLHTLRLPKPADDLIHHAVEVAPHIARREPQHAKAVSLQNSVSNRVVLGLLVVRVLIAVHFDDQAVGKAREVQEVATKRVLPSERVAAFPQALEPAPKDDFGFAHVVTEFASALDLGPHQPMLFLLCSIVKVG